MSSASAAKSGTYAALSLAAALYSILGLWFLFPFLVLHGFPVAVGLVAGLAGLVCFGAAIVFAFRARRMKPQQRSIKIVLLAALALLLVNLGVLLLFAITYSSMPADLG